MADRNGTHSEDPEKRVAILDQSIRTFAELGFRGADVQVIADRAAVGKGTVYRYFGNKEDLFWATTLEVMVRLERHLLAAMEGVAGAAAKLRAAAMAYGGFFEANPHYLEVFVQDRAEFRGVKPESHREHHRRIVERFGEIVQQGIDAGEFRPLDTRLTTLAFGTMLFGVAVLGCHLKDDLSIRDLTAHAIDVFLGGLRTAQLHQAATVGRAGVRRTSIAGSCATAGRGFVGDT